MVKVLLITDRLKHACGVTTYIYNLIKYSDADKIKFVLLAAPGDRISDFQKLGIEVIIDERIAYKGKNLLNALITLMLIVKMCFKFDIDVIHSQNYYLANISKIAKKIIKVKTVQTKNNLFPQGRLPQFNADNYIVVNKDIKRIAIKNYDINNKRIFEIPYGIQINEQNNKDISNGIKILVVSRLIHEKGVGIFIKAVSMIKSDIKDNAEFLIAGEGPEEKYLIELNKKLNAGIKFLGLVKNTQELFRQTHIFVIPSFWDMEGFPMTIIEAALSSNLIISSNFRGLGSYFHHNVDGLVFEKKDINGLKILLENAIKNYDNYQSIIQSTYSRYRNLFSLENMIKQTLKIYNI